MKVINMTDEQLSKIIKQEEAHIWRMQEDSTLSEEEAIKQEMTPFAENYPDYEFEVK